MKQEIHLANGAIQSLGNVLGRNAPKSVFLVHDKAAYSSSGAESVLTKVLRPHQVYRFCEFEHDPKMRDVERGLALFQKQDIDTLIAVGGGSTLDISKLIRIMAAQNASPADIVRDQGNIQRRGVPMIAIPTTAGTGSEATHFAVVYVNRTKHSIAHEYVLPDIVIIDPILTHSLPARITAATGMDALSQAIESFWCINSTEQSKAYAKEAIDLILNNLPRSVHEPSRETRYAMSKAAYLAGRAINISKTTAPHAVSYALTSYFGVPHGHAVGLTLGEFLVYNSEVNNRDVTDPRGVAFIRNTINEINNLLGTPNAIASREKLSSLMQHIGLETRLSELGINGNANHNMIADSTNFERVSNNPRKVTKDAMIEILQRIE